MGCLPVCFGDEILPGNGADPDDSDGFEMLTTTAGILGYESRLCPVFQNDWLKLIQNSRIKIDSQYWTIIGVCLDRSFSTLIISVDDLPLASLCWDQCERFCCLLAGGVDGNGCWIQAVAAVAGVIWRFLGVCQGVSCLSQLKRQM